MAMPVVTLGTHEGSTAVLGDFQQLRHPITKSVRSHVIGVGAETLILNSPVWRWWVVLLSVPVAAQRFEPVVLDVFFGQRR